MAIQANVQQTQQGIYVVIDNQNTFTAFANNDSVPPLSPEQYEQFLNWITADSFPSMPNLSGRKNCLSISSYSSA